MGGAGGIPWTAIDAYAARHEIDDFDRFKAILKGLDGVYLEHVADKMKAKKPGERKGRTARNRA